MHVYLYMYHSREDPCRRHMALCTHVYEALAAASIPHVCSCVVVGLPHVCTCVWQELAAQGIAVMAFDHQGHGYSGPLQG